MKKIKYFLVALFLVSLGCEEDDGPVSTPLANLSTTASVSMDDPGKVTFTSQASGASRFEYNFGDGTTGESLTGFVVKTYTMSGQNTYTVTITAYDPKGTSISETIQVTTDIAEAVLEEITLLTAGSSKKWFLAASQPGHLGVGPAREGIDGDWWYPKWYSASAFEKCGSPDSDCLCDDELTFAINSSGEVSFVLDNKGQTYFNTAHKGVVGGTEATDFCYDFDTTGTKSVAISMVQGNVPAAETTGVQLVLSDGGFMGYYVGSSTYEILSVSENLLYVRTYDSLNPDLAWYHRFTSESSTGGGDESLVTQFTNLVWADEFDVDGAPNPANWGYDLGAGGWGNGEAQSYTSDPENIKVENGFLKITAKATGSNGGATHYYDGVTLQASTGASANIEDFEGAAPAFTGFGGNTTRVIDNPDATGANTSSKVAESVKPVGAEVWAGSFFDLTAPLDLVTYNAISVKTWSPAAGAVVRLKLENKANAAEFFEVDANTTVAETWENLTFDVSGAPALTYDRVVLFFDFGVSPIGSAAYTSARIKSENLFEFTYGRVEVRAKLPSAGGTWPALWALGANFSEVGWPGCGEIDIMEHVGNNPNVVSSALHYPGNSGGSAVVGSTPLATATSEFHNYTVEWSADGIKFVVDDKLIHNNFVNSSDTPFNADFFLIMNIAVGGTLGGAIDPNFTQDTMEVDYIRVYQ